MKLSEMIQHVGDDYVIVQNIIQSSPEINECKKDGRVAFYTDKDKARDLIQQCALGDKGRWTALVLWLPTARLPHPVGLNIALSNSHENS